MALPPQPGASVSAAGPAAPYDYAPGSLQEKAPPVTGRTRAPLSEGRVIAPTSSYGCPGPKPAALWPMRQGWSSTRGLVPRAGESGRLLHRGGMDTQTGSGARPWALRLSCGVLVEAAEKALCDRISRLVRMVRSPCIGRASSFLSDR